MLPFPARRSPALFGGTVTLAKFREWISWHRSLGLEHPVRQHEMALAAPINFIAEEAADPRDEACEILNGYEIAMARSKGIIENDDGDNPGHGGAKTYGKERDRPPSGRDRSQNQGKWKRV